MENVTDALVMAGQVLIFIVALTVCISSFSTLRVKIDNAVDQTEVIKFAKDDTDIYINFIESRDSGASRIVSSETVVSSMYRSVKENYILYLLFSDSTFNTRIKPKFNGDSDVRLIDDGVEFNYGSLAKTLKGIECTLYNDMHSNYKINKILKDGLYDIIRGMSFKEYLGEYQNASAEGVSSENKTTKRIITYVEN